jgi:uncharacterized membrane protein YqaE (UPF0057 family)
VEDTACFVSVRFVSVAAQHGLLGRALLASVMLSLLGHIVGRLALITIDEKSRLEANL